MASQACSGCAALEDSSEVCDHLTATAAPRLDALADRQQRLRKRFGLPPPRLCRTEQFWIRACHIRAASRRASVAAARPVLEYWELQVRRRDDRGFNIL